MVVVLLLLLVVMVVVVEPSIKTFFTRCNVELTGENGEPGRLHWLQQDIPSC
jgi:hypothetical protein